MASSYLLIASILFFVFMMRTTSNYRLGIAFPAIIVIILPFLFSKFFDYLYLAGTNRPLTGLISVHDIVTLVVQLAVSFFVFYKIQQDEDAIVSWMLWGAAGCAVIFYVIPVLLPMVL